MKFENTQVFNFEGALRGMRNPMDSWEKSDSYYDDGNYKIGKNDITLATTLIKAGTEHRKFLRQIVVSVDITAPLYWFSEFDTYKIGTTANSTSTMHTIMSKPFSPELFETENLRGYKTHVVQCPNEIDPDAELWKEYPEDSNYFVSNQGRVKHLSYINTNGRIIKERIIAGSLHSDGYVVVTLVKGRGEYVQTPKHVLVAKTWVANSASKPEVNHKDGNKLNNSAENLEWATSQENQKHAFLLHLQPQHITTYKGKLSKVQRDEIIQIYSTQDVSMRQLAGMFGVTHTTICSIINNKYNYGEGFCNEYEEFLKTLSTLNELRDEWLETKSPESWETLVRILPRNWLQTRTITMNYENILSMAHQRKHHKLVEWREDFISWVRSLPYAKEFIFYDENEEI